MLVLGHSLNDAHLVAELKSLDARLGITNHSPAGGLLVSLPAEPPEALPQAHMIRMDFGPRIELDQVALEHWLDDSEYHRRCFSPSPP